jgi:hypothetical protein
MRVRDNGQVNGTMKAKMFDITFHRCALPMLIVLAFFAIATHQAQAAQKACFVPGKYSETNGLAIVDHESDVCKAFRRELNATCGSRIPVVDFKPQLKDSGLTAPKWEVIALYNADGSENENGFSRLRALAYAKAFTTYFGDKESLANRDVTSTLDNVRSAHAAGRSIVFERTEVDLEGGGKSESIYRLFANGTKNPMRIATVLGVKTEPLLFLERAVGMAASKLPIAGGGLASGKDLTGMSADLILFKDERVPYLLTWTDLPLGVLVYRPSATPTPTAPTSAKAAPQTALVLYERCVYEFKPQGK